MAEAVVEGSATLRTGDYVVLYNEQTDESFLVADLVNTGGNEFKTGVVFKGAGSAAAANTIAASIFEIGTHDNARPALAGDFFNLA